MGKGKRMRQQRLERKLASPGTAGTVSPPAVDDLEAQVMGLGRQLGATFLYTYLHVSLDLRDMGPLVTLPEPPPGQEAVYADILGKSLAIWEGVGDYRITRHAGNAADVFGKIAPIVQVPSMEQILAIGGEWLAESGYEPDYGLWFTGARTYATVMVPAAHRIQTLELLDWQRLHQQRSLPPETRLAMQLAGAQAEIPAERVPFSLTEVRTSAWAWDAVVREPEAMLHAAAALVCWLWNEPSAVIDPTGKSLTLTQELVMPLLNKGAAAIQKAKTR